MPAYYEWSCLKQPSRILREHPSCEVNNHPLKPVSVAIVNNKANINKEFVESLTKWSLPFEVADPLLRYENIDLDEPLEQDTKQDSEVNYTKSWITKRSHILQKYTTVEKLTIVSSYLPGGEKALIKQVSNLNEKVKHRLEQLDEFDEASVRKTMGLSQQEFIVKINLLNDEIKNAWATEQRVKAFKIAIQCSKLLADTTVMHFYPSKFVIITDILDMFGDLVYTRLKEKSFGKTDKSFHDIDPDLVPEAAKETCLNWIYKMASIRELLPRMYLEMTLLKCYSFISRNDIKSTIDRLTLMIRGIGDPIVAVYLRFYLCRVASKWLSNGCEDVFYANFIEFLDSQEVLSSNIKKKYESQAVSFEKYLSIYIPAVDWLLFGTLNSNKCKSTLLEEFLQHCKESEYSDLLLYCLLTSFDSMSIIKKSKVILEMIQQSMRGTVLQHDSLAKLGEHLCSVDAYHDVPAESLIQTWWKIANTIQSPIHFLQVLEPWLEFACKNLSSQHVNVILRGTIRYLLTCGKQVDDLSGQFQFVLKRLLNTIPDIEELFLLDAFMPLVELVQTTSARTLMAKTVLTIFFNKFQSLHIDDHIIIGSLMRLCCILHDSINAVTVEDEIKANGDLINKFIQAVQYQDDFELQLNFYVECRSAFLKLDSALVALVHAVNTLSVLAGAGSGAGAGAGAWLGKACAAFAFITVPSLRCSLAKLQLYLLSGQVALLNNCIGQAEANFKAFVSLIPDVPEFIIEDGQKKPTSVKVSGLLREFLSTLLILPDNVDSNCKAYVLSGFIKTLERIHWRKTDSLYYTTLLHTLDLLCNLAKENYSYHIESVMSNDVLYGSDEEFIEIIEKYATNICQELLVVLKALADSNETKKQSALSLELFWRVATRSDLNQAPMFSLAINLWNLNHKFGETQNKLTKSILTMLDNDENPAQKRLFQRLTDPMKTA